MYEVLFCKRRKPIIFKMSANASAQNIPIRRIQINHPGDMPSDYGTTPGGTLFSTTPGGTRIIYDRLFLLKCRDSPLSKTPPSNLPDIPGVTTPDKSPPKHVLGKVPEENGKPDGGGFQSSNYFQYPSYPCNLNITNNNYLQVLHHYVPGSRLVQYRQRQAMLSQQTSGVLFHPLSNHCMFQPCMDPTMHGMYSPPPTPLNHSSEMAPIFIHPIRGPATPIFDARSESQLTNWRRSQSIGIAAGMQGYTSERAPPIRSSFPNSSNMPHRNRGCDVSFQLNDNFCLNNDDSHRMSYRYGSCSDSDGSSSPDDPSIIACKPVQKYHFMDENANYAL